MSALGRPRPPRPSTARAPVAFAQLWRWEARPTGQTSGSGRRQGSYGDSGRRGAGPELRRFGKQGRLSRVGTAGGRAQREAEWGWWPVGPCFSSKAGPLLTQGLRGRRGLEEHLVLCQQLGCCPHVQASLYGGKSGRCVFLLADLALFWEVWGFGFRVPFIRAFLLWHPQSSKKKGLDRTERSFCPEQGWPCPFR